MFTYLIRVQEIVEIFSRPIQFIFDQSEKYTVSRLHKYKFPFFDLNKSVDKQTINIQKIHDDDKLKTPDF